MELAAEKVVHFVPYPTKIPCALTKIQYPVPSLTVDVRVHLADVVEVPVRHTALFRILELFVQQHVQLEMGLQEGQPPVAERLQGALVADPVQPGVVPVPGRERCKKPRYQFRDFRTLKKPKF